MEGSCRPAAAWPPCLSAASTSTPTHVGICLWHRQAVHGQWHLGAGPKKSTDFGLRQAHFLATLPLI